MDAWNQKESREMEVLVSPSGSFQRAAKLYKSQLWKYDIIRNDDNELEVVESAPTRKEVRKSSM